MRKGENEREFETRERNERENSSVSIQTSRQVA